jgi:hypothetical protein
MDLQGAVTATFYRGLPTYLNGKLSSIHSGAPEKAGN